MEIDFLINDRGELYDFIPASDKEEEIGEFKIPSIVNNVKVTSILEMGEAFKALYLYGVRKINKLVIEDGIEEIQAHAFSGIRIKIGTVYWPRTCPTIPFGCFSGSNIETIVGIENVKEIEMAALEGSGLKTFKWPPKCKTIPTRCFFNCSELETITGIEQVTNICGAAFAYTPIKEFSWPTQCREIPYSCFGHASLESISNIKNVTKIEDRAFEESSITKFSWPPMCKVVPFNCFFECMDLEQVDGLERVEKIDLGAFQGTAIKKFLWPASVSATKNEEFLIGCEHLEEIRFEGTGIKDVDLECFSCLKDVKKIDLSRCGAVNLFNATVPKNAEIKGKLVLPYYVTEVS